MKHLALFCLLIVGAAHAAELPVVTPLMLKQLADLPGKEALVISVAFPPGGADPIHRHDAHAFVYVVEGTVIMQLKGQPAVTLKPGDVFYEGPDDLHTVGRNASQTEPAKLLVVLIKNKGVDPVLPPN